MGCYLQAVSTGGVLVFSPLPLWELEPFDPPEVPDFPLTPLGLAWPLRITGEPLMEGAETTLIRCQEQDDCDRDHECLSWSDLQQCDLDDWEDDSCFCLNEWLFSRADNSTFLLEVSPNRSLARLVHRDDLDEYELLDADGINSLGPREP